MTISEPILNTGAVCFGVTVEVYRYDPIDRRNLGGRSLRHRLEYPHATVLCDVPCEGVFDATIPIQHLPSTISTDRSVVHLTHCSHPCSSQEGVTCEPGK